jgi:hypothetical protein
MKLQLGMTSVSYCHEESESNDEKDDCHIDSVKEEEENR